MAQSFPLRDPPFRTQFVTAPPAQDRAAHVPRSSSGIQELLRAYGATARARGAAALPIGRQIALWPQDLNHGLTPGGVARAVLSGEHPRLPGDPDHTGRDCATYPRSAVVCAWRAKCISATAYSRRVFSLRPSACARAPFRWLLRRLRLRSAARASLAPEARIISGCRHRPTFGSASRRIRRHREVSRVPQRKGRTLKGTPHGQAKNPRPPRPRRVARAVMVPARPTSMTTPAGTSEVQGDEARRGQSDLPDVPQPRRPRGMGRQRARARGISPAPPAIACTVRNQSSTSSSKRPQTEVCATCHRLQVAKTERAVAHMPVREGKMSCSSCHNPHGSISNVKNLKTGTRSPNSASAATPKCAARCCGSTRRCERTAPRATTRTARRTTACWSSGCRCCVSAVTSRRKHPATLYDKDEITDEQEQPHVRPLVRELSRQHPRLESSVRPVLHAVALGGIHAPPSLHWISRLLRDPGVASRSPFEPVLLRRAGQ